MKFSVEVSMFCSFVCFRRLNNNSLTGTCPESLSKIGGLTLVYVFLNSAFLLTFWECFQPTYLLLILEYAATFRITISAVRCQKCLQELSSKLFTRLIQEHIIFPLKRNKDSLLFWFLDSRVIGNTLICGPKSVANCSAVFPEPLTLPQDVPSGTIINFPLLTYFCFSGQSHLLLWFVDESGTHSNGHHVALAFAASFSAAFFVIFTSGMFLWWRYRRNKQIFFDVNG